MSRISIRGHEFEFSLSDIDALTKVSKWPELLGAEAQRLGAQAVDGDPIEPMRALLELETRLFDEVLGDGALSKVLGGKRDPVDGIEAFFELNRAVGEASKDYGREISQKLRSLDKYKPETIRG